jgi:hypothetical protein
MELALIVSSLVLGGVVLMGVVGYLVDKTAEPDKQVRDEHK